MAPKCLWTNYVIWFALIPCRLYTPSENDAYMFMTILTDICIDIVSTWELCSSEWLDLLQAGMLFRVRIVLEWINDAYVFIDNFSGIDFVSTLWHYPLKAFGSAASRYGFQGINNVGIIEWRIYEYTTRYDLHSVIWTLCGIAPQNDWTHSDQVRVSR